MLVERVREGGTDPAMPLGVRAWPGRPAASCCSLRSAALTSLSQFSRDLAMAPPTGGEGGTEAGIPRPRARVLLLLPLLRSDADRVRSGRNPSTAEGADLEASSGTVEKRSRKEGEGERGLKF